VRPCAVYWLTPTPPSDQRERSPAYSPGLSADGRRAEIVTVFDSPQLCEDYRTLFDCRRGKAAAQAAGRAVGDSSARRPTPRPSGGDPKNRELATMLFRGRRPFSRHCSIVVLNDRAVKGAGSGAERPTKGGGVSRIYGLFVRRSQILRVYANNIPSYIPLRAEFQFHIS
jgi:hypothetical protein